MKNPYTFKYVVVGLIMLILSASCNRTDAPITPGQTSNSADKALVSTSAANCLPPPSGLVGWWTGDTDASDFQGNNDGTLFNGVLAGVPGMVDGAFSFDGVDDYALVSASSSLNVGLGEGFTIDVWIKGDNLAAAQPIIEFNNGLSAGSTFGFLSVPP